ncbi:dermonecrotic toxin domain-containing protein [Pseudomonas sp. EA_65y_Pfl2_P74]|uniref:dermonecrotic toxin domain-containing protein n=1 Tax=Pseudomonas sp. EA_65y_Pfl2_P74 TaxID=3088694 RepID=UPI0030D8532D
MHLPQGQHPTARTDTTDPQHPDDHYQHLKNALPDWLANVSPTRRQALKKVQPSQTLTLQAVSTAQHQRLKALNAEHWTAQSEVDTQLEHLQDASAFAEPLLKQALKSRFDLDVDVRKTFLRLYIPATTPWFPISTGARTWTVSLLDAALHNFEEKETRNKAFEADSTYITQPSSTGQFDTLPSIKAKLSIANFTKLCRELDIGAQYKTHLEAHLGFSDPAVATSLRQKIDASEKAAMRAALQMALMNRDISQSSFRLIDAMLDGLQGIRINSVPVVRHDVTMMGATLTGIVVFAPSLEEARKNAQVVAYVPEDPEHPFKEYASALEMVIELTRQLRSKDYQHFFSRFVNHEHRGFFFSGLNDRLSKIKWHPSEKGSSEPAWRASPVERPNLETAFIPFHDDLWQHLYQAKLNKILNDARFIAVPTASVDQKARWAFWDSVVNIISTIVQTAALVVAPFVPVLGEAMMAYMAYQFLNEAFEGIIEWAQGRTTEAFEHLMSTLESLIQLGLFAVGGNIAVAELPKILPKEIVAFIDRFKTVKMTNEQVRYWDPDLGRYQQESAPDADSTPNQLGLHEHQGKHLLPLENAHFAVSESTIPGQYRIEHPTRPDAYQPLLRHNGDGAWHTELEQPLEWDKPTALRRIGPLVESFSPLERETILQVSGVNEGALRKMHVEQEKLPPLLADSIQRFKIDQQLQRFNDYLSSDAPEQYLRADPVMQLQLLTEQGRWPAGKRLRLLDKQGELIWQSSSDERLPLTELHQDSLIGDDLLKSLFYALDEAQGKALLGMEFSGPTPPLDVRSQMLRKQLAQLAMQQRSVMFEARYQALQHSDDPLAQPLLQHDPALPAAVTRELLATTTSDELLAISEGQVPARQQQLMQLARQEVRVTRAYEGLELDSVNNPDSDTLALHSLKLLPGWSGDVRIEIRDGYYEGPILDSTGRSDAPAQKILVRKSDGNYQPYDERAQELHSATDFYSSLLHALPDADRRALNLQISDAGKLKQAIRANPMARSELRVAIAQPPLPEPVIDTLRLVGVESHPPTRSAQARTLAERILEVYPNESPAEVQMFIFEHQRGAGGVRGELSRLHREYIRLSDDLRRWQFDVPSHDPQTGLALTPIQRRAALQSRSTLRRGIERCWRKQTRGPAGYLMQITDPIIGELPVLDADFSHVTSLAINGIRSTRGVDQFLQRFPTLMYLDVQNANLPNLPSALTSMPVLRQLILRNCNLRLGAGDQVLLASLSDLSVLDLQDNPLGLHLDIQPMTSLRLLNLTNTGITEAPANLLSHPRLVSGKFASNLITEVPDALFTLNSMLSDGFNFADNPLSAASRERVKTHYQRTTKHFGVVPEEVDINRTINLFAALEPAQATDVFYQLPGTLAQGRAQLTQWEVEFRQMKDGLAQWSRNIPENDPTTGQPLNLNEQSSELMHRERFAQALEQFWGSRTPHQPTLRSWYLEANLDFIGDLPTLDADFSHVSKLSLTGNKDVSALTPFLHRFRNLEALHLFDFDLEPASSSIIGFPRLTTLELKNCAVVLTPENQAALCTMSSLETLELGNNPLGTLPDLNLLPNLTYIDVSNAGLSTVPDGVIDHPNLRTMIFSDNLITELPEAIFELPPNRSDGMDFADNPLSAATRERIKIYYRKTGQDFDVQADPADIAVARELFPQLDAQEASDMIYDLPGTLVDSHDQLGRWQTELTTLTANLATWAPKVPSLHPVTGEALTAIELLNEYAYRKAFGQKLENFWRHRLTLSGMRDDSFSSGLPFIGDMPVLTTDFSHVSNLHLKGNPALRGIEPFLDLFPRVQSLEMRDLTMEQFPAPVGRMQELKDLTLNHCQLTLTPEGQNTLISLSDLERLDLSNNPLTLAPDIAAMPKLNDIRLSNCSLTELPNGLEAHPNLKSVLLESNRITELPEAFFQIDADLADGVDLYDNPLSDASRDRIKTFYNQQGCDLGVQADRADIGRARALFPELEDEDANHMIYKLPGSLDDGRAQLLRWESEMAQMDRDLNAWTEAIAASDPETGQPLSTTEVATEREARQEFSNDLQQFWRQRRADKLELRSNTLTAELPFTGDLPALSADFSHVKQLSLQGKSTQNVPDAFLNCFPGLSGLEMRDIALRRWPQALNRMPSLLTLALSNCGVVFDAQAQAMLSGMRRLTMLDLYKNPLGVVPDVSPLKALTYLDLSETGIDSVPAGLTEIADLNTVLLNDNRITELPEALYNLPDPVSNGIALDDNPMSAKTRDQIKAYYQRTGRHFFVLAEQADVERVQALYPHFSQTQASDLIYHLPGTLADGRVELARRETELTTLNNDLEHWMNAQLLDPVTRQSLEPQARLQEQSKRMKFKESLENAWRRKSSAIQSASSLTLDLSFIGDPPALAADFGHVLELDLTSTATVAPRTEGLLARFPNLLSLKMRGFELESIPAEVLSMKKLKLLNLPECSIRLTEDTANALGTLEEIDSLDLSNNPLGRAPDISRMKQLTRLDLSNTGLTETWPALFDSITLSHADLSDNAITELSIEILRGDRQLIAHFNFDGNPLSGLARRRLEDYAQLRAARLNEPRWRQQITVGDDTSSSSSSTFATSPQSEN